MKKIETFIKNIILRLLLLFSNSQKKNTTTEFNEDSKILFIRLNRIGDALVTTPLLHEVKKNFGCKIYLLADRKNYFVFKNNPDIDELLVFKKGLLEFVGIREFISKQKIDTVVDLHDDVSTTVSFIVAISNAKNKFGLEKENKIIYTKTVPRINPSANHVIDRCLELTKLFEFEADKKNANVIYNPSNEFADKADSFLTKNISEKKFLIGINISAGSDARFWGIERFKKLLEFISEFQVNSIIISAPGDMEKAKAISSEKNIPVFSSEVYDEFAAMISKLDMLFTPDTAAVHLASAFRIPVFGIYVKFKTKDIIWYPYKSDYDVVVTEEPDLKNVTFEEVIEKFKPFLTKLLKSINEQRNSEV